jgi:AmmeMemoRadiSam system protein B/AmmeMemoRadiSam system protein A
MFYEADTRVLQTQVDTMLADAGPREPTALTGIIVPHAGHVYSGPVAAHAYRLVPMSVRRVLLIGPSHFVPLRTMAASAAAAWRTPLGDVAVDTAEVTRLSEEFPRAVVVDDIAHGREHCLEVQVPFLQRVLAPDWALVPLVVGHIDPEAVAEVIDDAMTMPGTLLVVSTDLSHYLPYRAAAAQDARTAEAISAVEPDRIADDDACGCYALRGALTYAQQHDLAVERRDLRSSGDTAGPRDRVVGYGAFTIAGSQQTAEATPTRADRIVALARRTIEDALRTGRQALPSPLSLDEDLRDKGAAFVTLRSGTTGELLGCVGSLEAHRPLGVDVAAHALDAAFHDHRFASLTDAQAAQMRVEVSVLGPLEELPVIGYEDLVARVPIGKGLYICAGGYRATFLPGVWRELPARASFVASLWRKAGLVPGTWPDGMRAFTYEVAEYQER